jgi:transposase
MTNLKQSADFSGKTIYVGMDVHLKSWDISLYFDQQYLRSFHQPPQPEALAKTLKREYPNATFKCAYEAGFGGFWAQRKLQELGLSCMVVNAADVPQTDKGIRNKTDRSDSKRIGEALQGGLLHPIYIPAPETESDRRLVRYRHQLNADLTKAKVRIKSLLHHTGISLPAQYSKANWSQKFIQWLKELPIAHPSLQQTLQRMINQVEGLRKELTELTKQIRELLQSDGYKENAQLLLSIPGIGPLTAITLLVEIADIHRFETFTQFNSFIGFCPMQHSSGEDIKMGSITTRHHSALRSLLIEAAWVAVRIDPALTLSFSELKKRITAKRAIIRIARKLLNRIWHVWTKKEEYENGIIE